MSTLVPARIVLVNALRNREDVYVLDKKGRPVILPRVSPPTVVADSSSQEETTIAVLKLGKGDKGRYVENKIQVKEGMSASCVIGELPAYDGVWYLVDPIVKAQFPDRDDFVVPDSYGMWMSRKYEKKLQKTKSKKQRKKVRRKAVEEFDHGVRFPLIAVARGPVPLVSPETPVLDLGD